MASNLSCIGFAFETDEAFRETMSRLASDVRERLAVDGGDYAIWRSRTGAEIWFHLQGERSADGELSGGDLIGLTPFFEGSGDEIELRVEDAIRRPGDNPFEGALRASIASPADDPDGFKASDVVFDAVDFAAHATRRMPFQAAARLVGFARQLHAFADDAAHQAHSDLGPVIGPDAVVAFGLMIEQDQIRQGVTPQPPSSNVLINGRVLSCAVLHNEETGFAFHHLVVESAAATFDIVADPDVIEGDVVPGAVVAARCWLAGRLA